jgi:plastocyanin
VLAGGAIWAVANEDDEPEAAAEEPGGQTPGGQETGGASPSPSAGPGGGSLAVQMHDNYFALDGGDHNPDITAAPGDELTVTNEGTAVHNMRVDGPDGAFNTSDDVVSDPDIVRGGQESTLTVDVEAGDYKYQCDFHPQEMAGTLTVE